MWVYIERETEFNVVNMLGALDPTILFYGATEIKKKHTGRGLCFARFRKYYEGKHLQPASLLCQNWSSVLVL